MAKVIDTNLIIRFLLNDNPRQADSVKLLFASLEKLLIPDMVIAEIIWVLQSVYKFSKSDTTEKVQQFLSLNIFICNYKLLGETLMIYKENKISFVDAYLLALSLEKDLEGIYSFDKGLDKVKQIKRFDPSSFSSDN